MSKSPNRKKKPRRNTTPRWYYCLIDIVGIIFKATFVIDRFSDWL